MSSRPTRRTEAGSAAPASEDVASALCRRQRPPGLSLATVTPSGTAWSGGFGLADIEAAHPADEVTVYLWFSMTKLVTATAVLQLVDRDELDPDTSVRTLVPAFPQGSAGDRVTVRHLLSHSAGLANPIPVSWVRPATAPAEDSAAFCSRLLRKHSRLRSEPGTRASYSNLGYLVLGEVIEAVTGTSYVDYVRAQILEPLAMSETGFVYPSDREQHVARGYHPRFDIATPFLRLMVPTGIFDHRVGNLWALSRFCVQGAAYGGLIGTVSDAARFLHLHLEPEAHPGVLSPRAVAAMQHLSARGRKLDVGLGWFRRRGDPADGHRYWEHLGGGGGFFSTMRVYPDVKLGLVAMGNATRWDHLRLVHAAVRDASAGRLGVSR